MILLPLVSLLNLRGEGGRKWGKGKGIKTGGATTGDGEWTGEEQGSIGIHPRVRSPPTFQQPCLCAYDCRRSARCRWKRGSARNSRRSSDRRRRRRRRCRRRRQRNDAAPRKLSATARRRPNCRTVRPRGGSRPKNSGERGWPSLPPLPPIPPLRSTL